MVATGDNPQQLYSNPLPKPPSSGGVGDFLRGVFSTPPTASTTRIPTAEPVSPILPAEVAPSGVAGPAISDAARAQIYNAAQAAVGLGRPNVAPARVQPQLAQVVQRTGLPAYDDQSALVRAPRGYTAPTKGDIATAEAISRARFEPYRRAQAMQDRTAKIKDLEALARIAQINAVSQPKVPTFKEQLLNEAYKSLNEQYKLSQLEIDQTPNLSDDDRKKRSFAARKNFLSSITNLAQPPFAGANLITPNASAE